MPGTTLAIAEELNNGRAADFMTARSGRTSAGGKGNELENATARVMCGVFAALTSAMA